MNETDMPKIQKSSRLKEMFMTDEPSLRFKLLPAIGIAYLTPILLAIFFTILGAAQNPSLAQIYLLLMAISFGLTGILTRSKIKSLLNVIVAPLSFLTIYFLTLTTNGLIYNVFGGFSSVNVEGQLGTIANNLEIIGQSDTAQVISSNISTINNLFLALDLTFVIFLALFLGLPLAVLSTGFRTKGSSISVIALVSKPIAAFFVIFLLVLFPFTYHLSSNLVVGAIDLATGATELNAIFGGQNSTGSNAVMTTSGVTQVDIAQLNLTDPEVQQYLKEKVQAAKEWFAKAATRFDQVQGNWLLQLVLQAVVPPEISLTTGDTINTRKLPELLDFTDIMVDLLDAFPYLLTGYFELVEGAELVQNTLNSTGFGSSVITATGTLSISNILQQSVQYDPAFKIGLQKIQNGVNEFKKAERSLISATDKAIQLVNNVFVSDSGSTKQSITQTLEEIKYGLPIALNASRALIPAANGTYEALLAQKALGSNDFPTASKWLSFASADINVSETLLQKIDLTPLEQINSTTINFKAAFEFLRDLISTYGTFIQAMQGSVESFVGMNATLVALDSLNLSEINPNSPQWSNLRGNITTTRTAISKAETAFQEGVTETTSYISKARNDGYGPFSTNALDIFSTVNDFYSTFSSNITDYKLLVYVFELPFNSTYEFSAGQYHLKLAIQEAINGNLTGSEFGNLTNTVYSKNNFTLAQQDSQEAYNLLSLNISGINPDTRERWKDALYEGVNNNASQSIYGASGAGISFIDTMSSSGNFSIQYAQQVLDYFDAINLGAIFQQGGGTQFIVKTTSAPFSSENLGQNGHSGRKN